MKTLLLICLILINISCGKRKNDFSNRYQFSSVERDADSVKEISSKKDKPLKKVSSQKEEIAPKIVQIEVPNLKLLDSKFILSQNRSIKFKSHSNAKNLMLRQDLLKLITQNFRSERVTKDLKTFPFSE